MTEQGEWHADERLLAGYVTGALPLPAAMSLEQHVMRCARCRDAVAAAVDPGPLEAVWQRVESRVEGSLRTRRRQLWFRLRTALRGRGAGGWRAVRPPSLRPLVGGVALLSVGYLAFGLLALGGPARGPVLDADLPPNSAELARVHDGGARPGELAPARGWSSLLREVLRPGTPV